MTYTTGQKWLVVFDSAGGEGKAGGIYTFPYFCAFLLKDYLKRADLDRNK